MAAADFAEMRRIVGEMPGPDTHAAAQAASHQAQLTKPAGALGRLEEIAVFLASWQGRHPPRLERPRVAVFAGNHGVAARGVSAYPPEVTAQMVRNFIAGGAAINQLTALIDGDLRIYEMDLAHPTADFTAGPAMDEARCARAMAYGMMAVEPGIDVLCLGEMGIANTTSAAALCLALHGGEAPDWVGPGTGAVGETLARKRQAVALGVTANRALLDDPLQALRAVGGEELAAIAGAVIAARMARVPVLLDGYACCAAAAVLKAIDPGALDHCLVAHLSAEPGHVRLLQRLNMRPLLDLEMHLGEGTGAAVAVNILKAAVACHTGMASFAQAGVSGPA